MAQRLCSACVVRVGTAHDPMLSAPVELAALLNEVSGGG
jgi:hypothetical protein